MEDNLPLPPYQKVEPNPLQKRAIRIMRGTRTYEEKYFESLDELIEAISYLRSVGCKIGLTMGSWDLFHGGHAKYIRAGRREVEKIYPDAEKVIMVVGVDSDELTRSRKGPNRPVAPEDERSAIIGELESVDVVIMEHELGYLHKHLPHDVRVISTTTSDLTADEETSRYCERVVNLPPQAETSTTARIRLLFTEGVQEALEKIRAAFERSLKEVSDVFKV